MTGQGPRFVRICLCTSQIVVVQRQHGTFPQIDESLSLGWGAYLLSARVTVEKHYEVSRELAQLGTESMIDEFKNIQDRDLITFKATFPGKRLHRTLCGYAC